MAYIFCLISETKTGIHHALMASVLILEMYVFVRKDNTRHSFLPFTSMIQYTNRHVSSCYIAITIFINNTKYKGYIRKLTNIHKIFVTLLSAPDYRMMKVTPYYNTAIFVLQLFALVNANWFWFYNANMRYEHKNPSLMNAFLMRKQK